MKTELQNHFGKLNQTFEYHISLTIHSDKKILIQNIIALPSQINAKAVSLMG